MTLEASGAEVKGRASEPDSPLELPFSTEPGVGLSIGGDLFATGLRHEPRGAVALLGRLASDALPSQLLELGRLQGDVSAPRLARDGADLVVGVHEPVPGGHQIRVARVRGGALDAPLSWHPGPRTLSDESNAFELVAHAGQVVIAWDDWSPSDSHGRVLVATMTLDGAVHGASSSPVEGRSLSASGIDAERPRLTERPGGYWLGWLANAARGEGRARVYDPGGRDQEDRTAQLSYGARWIEILPLDFQGHPVGELRRLTAKEERVVGYDLTTSPAGHAWIVWRQGAVTPTASGGRVLMAELRSDGSRDVAPVREENLGSGEPSWLAAGVGEAPWLTFPDAQDSSVLMRIDRFPPGGTALRLPADMNTAAALAASGEQLLFATPRGRAVELFAATCNGAAPAALAPRSDAGRAARSLFPDAGPLAAPGVAPRP